jgi:hypothetical protein
MAYTTGGAGDRTVILTVRGELDLATASTLYQGEEGAGGQSARSGGAAGPVICCASPAPDTLA